MMSTRVIVFRFGPPTTPPPPHRVGFFSIAAAAKFFCQISPRDAIARACIYSGKMCIKNKCKNQPPRHHR